MTVIFFFFQAEDGIRDLVRSRGLGDVYKRQELGVRGKKLHYGEEIELQVKMRREGFTIGYAPSLRTDHFVRTDKLSMSWVLRSEYARRRDKMSFDRVPLPIASLHLLKTMAGRLIWTPVHLFTCLFNKSYSLKKDAYKLSLIHI